LYFPVDIEELSIISQLDSAFN